MDLFSSVGHSYIDEVIQLTDGSLRYRPNHFGQFQSDSFLNYLLREISWQQDIMKLYGREIPLPRLSAWYGDTDKPYTYSGIKLAPKPWTSELLEIKKSIEAIAGVAFSSVLLNRYRDGSDYVGWHSDDEKELGKNPVIGSVNFGATRKFQLRRIADKTDKVELPLGHGSLLIMQGETQHYWQHQVPKTNRPKQERVNLTFRNILH